MEDTETDIVGDKKTIASLTKPPTSLMSGRIQPCFIVLACLMILVSILFIPLWMIKLEQIEREVDSIDHNVISSEIKAITKLFYNPLNSTATNLAAILTSAIEDEDMISFSTIQSKVAPVLFQVLTLTVPWLSQVYYAGPDGLFLSYYYPGDDDDDRSAPFALYSNSSNDVTTGQRQITWYSQPVDRHNGKLYGEAINVTHAWQKMNASWIHEAIAHHEKGYGSLGHILNNQEEGRDDLLFMRIAGLKNKLGAVSLGFSANSLTNLLLSDGGKLFLSTVDGRVLIRGIPNTSLVVDDGHDSVSFVTATANWYRRDRIRCGKEQGDELWGGEYVGYCEFVDIIGVKSVYAVVVPIKNEGLVHKDVKLAKVIAISMGGAVLALAIFFTVVMVRARRREMFLRASLIKQMEATQQAERRCMNKSLAVTSTSHDIRASLAGLVGLIQLCHVRVCSAGMEELKNTLEQMETCAKDLLIVLNSVMDISRIEAGKIELEEEVFSMSNLLEEVVDLYHPAGMKKGVDVILDPCDGSISRLQYLVRGDRTKLKQILWNLLNNAVKFTSQGHIVVRAWARSPSLLKEERDMFSSCTQTNSFCCFLGIVDKDVVDNVGSSSRRGDPNCWEFVIEVEDTGKGIPKEKQKFVFENYVQVKETAVANQQGTGLGLGIVQSLVRIMGGEITIVDKDQVNYERGTCFRFNTLMTLENNFGSGSGSRSGQQSTSSSPKLDQNSSSVVVLFIQSSQRQLVIEKFMTGMGIKVHAVKEWENFPRVLKKVKQKLLSNTNNNNNNSSGRSDVSSRVDCMSSLSLSRSAASRSSSNTKIREFPLSSMMEGRDEQLKIPNFVLLVIDANGGGPFRDLSRAVAEFRRDIPESCCCTRIVWIDKPAGESIQSKGLDEDKLPPTDLIVYKPLHGSQLDNIIGLLPEFGGSTVPERRRTTNSSNEQMINQLEVLDTAFRQGATGVSEIQQVESDKVLEGKRVLIVDDNGVLRMLAMNIVSRLGGTVEVCENGKEAVELVCQRLISRTSNQTSSSSSILPLYDYILMDCEMPIMDGFKATTRIREEESRYGVRIPIIALTAHAKEEVDAKNRMFEVGMDLHLIKPLTIEQLIEAIVSLSLHHQHQNSNF